MGAFGIGITGNLPFLPHDGDATLLWLPLIRLWTFRGGLVRGDRTRPYAISAGVPFSSWWAKFGLDLLW